MTMIGAAYLRCSDPKQDKSIDQQRVEIQRRAEADGVVIPPENWFIDEGISGRSTKRRVSYQSLLKRAEAQRDAMRGKGRVRLTAVPIERLYVWAFSRIARNMFDCLKAMATLDDADIDIVSLTEHDTGDRSMRKLDPRGHPAAVGSQPPSRGRAGHLARAARQLIIKNPVYCGHVVNKGEVVHRHAHEAAVDDVTFARVQAKRALKGQVRAEGGGNGANPLLVGKQGVLTPFLRCGSCGGRVTLVAGSRKEQRTWPPPTRTTPPPSATA